MLAHCRAAVVSLILLSVVTGIAYPAIVTAIAQIAFPRQANGTLIVKDGKTLVLDRFDLRADGTYRGFEDFCVLNARQTAEKYRGSYETSVMKRFMSRALRVMPLRCAITLAARTIRSGSRVVVLSYTSRSLALAKP